MAKSTANAYKPGATAPKRSPTVKTIDTTAKTGRDVLTDYVKEKSGENKKQPVTPIFSVAGNGTPRQSSAVEKAGAIVNAQRTGLYTAERESLLGQLNELERNYGGHIALEPDGVYAQQQRALTDKLHRLDAAQGKPLAYYTPDERAGGLFSGSLLGSGAGYLNAGGTLVEADAESGGWLTYALNTALSDGGYAMVNPGGPNYGPGYIQAQRDTAAALQGKADELRARSDAELNATKAGLGKGGKFLVDAGSNLLQMGGDAAAAALTGGSSLVPMAIRTFGSAAQDARFQGADLQQQIATGAATAAVEVLTESMFDGLGGLMGGGNFDGLTDALVARLTQNAAGQAVLKAIIGMAEEGGEEFVSALASPLIDAIAAEGGLSETAAQYGTSEFWANAAYDVLVGMAVSGMTGGPRAVYDAASGKVVQTEQQRAAAEAEQQQTAAPQTPVEMLSNYGQTAQEAPDTSEDAGRVSIPATTQKPSVGQPGEFNTQGRGGEDAASTYIDTSPQNHTAQQQRIIDEYVASVDNNIKNFISKVKTLTNSKYRNKVRYSISEVSPAAANEVQRLTGVNVEGFENIITGGAIDHIEKRHGAAGKQDHSMANPNDIARVDYVLSNFDGARLLTNKDGSPSVSDVWKNADNSPAPRILFWKALNGTYYVAQAAPDSNSKVLAIESLFIGTDKNREGIDPVLNLPSGQQVTPKAPQGANAFSGNNIPNGQLVVNGNLSAEDIEADKINSLAESEAPPETPALYSERTDTIPLTKAELQDIIRRVRKMLPLKNNEVSILRNLIRRYNAGAISLEQLYSEIEANFGTVTEMVTDKELQDIKTELRDYRIRVSDATKRDIADYSQFAQGLYRKLTFAKDGTPIDIVYMEMHNRFPGYFPPDIINPADQLRYFADVANAAHSAENTYTLSDEDIRAVVDAITRGIDSAKQARAEREARTAAEDAEAFERATDLESYIEQQARQGEAPRTPAQQISDAVEQQRARTEQAAAVTQFESDDLYGALGSVYGTIPAGENAAREANVPAGLSETTRTGRGVRTVMEAKATPEGRMQNLRDAVVDGKFEHVPVTLKGLADEAERTIKSKGWDGAYYQFLYDVEAGKASAELNALGAVLLNNAGNSPMSAQQYVDLAVAYNTLGHRLGSGLAAARVLKTLSPQGKLYAMTAQVKKINEARRTKKPKGSKAEIDPEASPIEIPQAMIADYLAAKDDATRGRIMEEMEQYVADRLPASALEKWNAWRYMSMLGNFKTPGRNVVGNALSGAITMFRNKVRAVLEYGYSALTGGRYERNTSFFVRTELRKQAMQDAIEMDAALHGQPKYSDFGREFNRGIQEKRTIFPNKTLEAWRKASAWMLENEFFGDTAFLRAHYAESLGGWLQAHGITNIADATPEQMERGREWAIKDAQEATFRDHNKFSNWVARIGRGKGTPAAVKVGVEGTLPFRRTPANVLVRAEEYSPLGTINTAVKAVQAAKGAVEAADVINSASKTLTGYGLTALGWAMAAASRAEGGKDDEEDKALSDFRAMQGDMEYSVKLFGKNISLSQFAPATIPFFMGAELYESLHEGDSMFTADTAIGLMEAVAGPMVDASFLSSVQELLSLGSGNMSDGEKIMNALLSIAFSYVTQGIPTILGQIEQTHEENRQTTYTDPENPLGSKLQYQVSRAASKIPGWDFNTQDYIDAWGRRQSNGSGAERAFNAFLNPTYTSDDRSTAVDAELERLYRDNANVDGFPMVLPQRPSRSLSYAPGERLSPQEFQDYSIARGQMSLDLVSNFIGSEEYAMLTDMQRAEVISSLYAFSADRAMLTIKEAHDIPYTGDWGEEAELSDLPAYLSARTVLRDGSDGLGYDAVDRVIGSFGSLPEDVQDQLTAESGLHATDLRYAAQKGVDAEQYYGLADAVRQQRAELDGSSADLAAAIAINSTYSMLSDIDRLTLLQLQCQPDNEQTGRPSAIVRRYRAAGVSGFDFDRWTQIEAAIRDASEDGSISKAEIIKAAQSLGLDGNLIYSIYKDYSGLPESWRSDPVWMALHPYTPKTAVDWTEAAMDRESAS